MKFQSQFTINKEEKLMTPEAERFNGWAAMLGFVAAVGAYTFTGQIIPGIFLMNRHPVPLRIVPYIFAMALGASTLTNVFV